jgi:hypothetical protein
MFLSSSFEQDQNNDDANAPLSQDADLDNDSDDIDDERALAGPPDSFFGDFSLSRFIDEACPSHSAWLYPANSPNSSSPCGLPRDK